MAQATDTKATAAQPNIQDVFLNYARRERLPVVLHLPAALSAEQRTLMERTAHACPVHHSLLSDVDKSIVFVYDK